MRGFLSIIIPLLLPTLVYLGYLYFLRPRPAGAQGESPREGLIPWVWLAAAGAVLAVGTFFALAHLEEAPPGSRYVPARVIDGQIEPGHFE